MELPNSPGGVIDDLVDAHMPGDLSADELLEACDCLDRLNSAQEAIEAMEQAE